MTGHRWAVLGKRAVKTTLALLVIAAVARQIVRTVHELSARGETLRLDPAWLAAAVALYTLGLVPFGLFYARLLQSSATPVGWQPALRAYLVSHLGKYVPGKALVVVMRAGLSVPFGARPATAAIATLYETLVMMVAGGAIAALGFAFAPSRWVVLPLGALGTWRAPLPLLGVAAAAVFALLVEARVFRRLVRLVSLPFPNVGPDAIPRLGAGLLALGLLWAALGWTLMGLSQVAVLRGLGFGPIGLAHTPAVVASVALATVAGFAVPISPGGLGVREWVLWTSLGSLIDRDRAVVAALALRLAWVVGEVLAGALFYSLRMTSQRSSPKPSLP